MISRAPLIDASSPSRRRKSEIGMQTRRRQDTVLKAPVGRSQTRNTSKDNKGVVERKNQFGFLQGRSTTTQLLSTFHDFARSRNSSVAKDVVFLDLAKAFDSVPHERLLIKLYSLGIESKLLNWLRHFLTCRKQRVVVRGTFSDWAPVISGTPQGTILGPILFLSYINDIVDSVSSKIQLFADDRKIFRELCNPSLDEQYLQTDLNNLGKWAKKWQLRFNEEKCEAMRITHSRDKSNTNYKLGMVLKDVKSFKDLGITISKDLTWSEHISTIVNKANQVLGLIRRTLGQLTLQLSHCFIKLWLDHFWSMLLQFGTHILSKIFMQ